MKNDIIKIEEETVYLESYWEKLEKSKIDYGKERKWYVGNWFQRLFHIGPYEIYYPDPPREIMDNVSKYLNLSVLAYDSDIMFNDLVYFGNYKTQDKAIEHVNKDDCSEAVKINFNKLRSDIEFLVVAINSFSHEKIEEIPYITLDIHSSTECRSIKKIEFKNKTTIDQQKEAIILGIFYKVNSDWFFKKSGLTTNDRTISGIASGIIKEELRAIKNGE